MLSGRARNLLAQTQKRPEPPFGDPGPKRLWRWSGVAALRTEANQNRGDEPSLRGPSPVVRLALAGPSRVSHALVISYYSDKRRVCGKAGKGRRDGALFVG